MATPNFTANERPSGVRQGLLWEFRNLGCRIWVLRAVLEIGRMGTLRDLFSDVRIDTRWSSLRNSV